MEDLEIRLANPDAHRNAEKFKSVAMDLSNIRRKEITTAKLREMKRLGMVLMQDPGVHQCFACSYEFYLPDSAEYFSRRVSAKIAD